MSNIEIGSLQDNYFHIGSTGKTEPTDTYFFSLPTMGSAGISAVGFSGDINMELRDKEGRLIKSISTSGKNTGILSTDNLGVADYILNVSPVSGNTNYQVSLTPDGKVDPLTGMGVEAGFFTTDQKGEVGFDFLHDGGRYKGEVAIFSLDGMEKFTPDSKEFIKEAAKRSLSDSVLGHIVISESTEGANPEFRGSLGEENYNNEPYKGVKTFTMSPGKAFTVMLVPNGKVQEVFDNPEVGGDKRPLFSLSSSNPNDAWLYGQIADVTGAGQAFSIENQGVDTGSDRDYQDIIFKVTGATGKAVLLKEVINPAKDWTTSEGGNKLIDFITLNPPKNTPPSELKFDLKSIYTTGETIDFRSGKVADTNGANNLDKIDFGLQKDGGKWTEISDTTTFTSDSLDNRWASFNYTLTGLAAGKYQLKAIAYDRAGAASNEVLRNLLINSAPGDLQFRSLPLYTKGEKISCSGAKVFDTEGVSDIAKVDFGFQKEGGEKIEIAKDVTEFTSDSDGFGRFNFSENLSSLAPDRYQLSAKAYDQAGNAISEASEKFALISEPGSDGLSDEVRVAIVGAANLDSYPPEALAEAKEGVVWVIPEQSSRELAAIIDAIYQGDIDRITNRCTCKCPKPIARENEADQLKALSGVEYAYPQVPVQLNLVYEPNDTLYNKQWNFKNANVPAAWDVINPATSQTVGGRGATIAIVDDGLEYEYPDLANPYSHSLSWDFADNIRPDIHDPNKVSCGARCCAPGM